MISAIEHLNRWGTYFLSFAWPMLWQSSLLIVVLLAIDVLFRRKIRASVRYALWLLVLVKLCLPPALALPTGAAWWLFPKKAVTRAVPAQKYVVTYDSTAPLPDSVFESVPVLPPPAPRLDRLGWLLLGCGLVSCGLLVWLGIRWWQISEKIRRTELSEEFSGLLEEIRHCVGLHTPLRLKFAEGRMSPAVCGLFRPVILLPRVLAKELSAGQLRAVLLHEAFHLRRKDVWLNCTQALVQIVYWWHPLLWLANARIRRLREEAVDDAVMLALRGEADHYAPTLLAVVKLVFRRPMMSLGLVGIMESRSALQKRIERLMNFAAPRKAGLTLISLLGIMAFAAVAVPMGEAPSAASPAEQLNSTDAAATEQQSLTLQVDPKIFIRNVKSQAPRCFLSPTNDYTAILLDLLQSEGVDCTPSNGIAFNTQTGEIITQNTPDKLRIFQRVIEQLNRADGICELPLGNNPLRKDVLIEARLYQMTDADFENYVSGLQFYRRRQGDDAWWSATPEQFKDLIGALESSGQQLIQRPRIQTGTGIEADFFVGNGTNSVQFDCKPYVKNGFIDVSLRSAVAGVTTSGSAFTNHFRVNASALTGGGIVVRVKNYGGETDNNLAVFIGMELVTNTVHFQERLRMIIRPHATTGSTSGRGEPAKLASSDRTLETVAAIADLKKQLAGWDKKIREDALRKFASSPFMVTVAENPALVEVIPVLIQATKDADRIVRSNAVDALRAIRSQDPEVLDALGNLVAAEPDLNTAVTAASALKELGPAAAPAVPDLLRALEGRKDDGLFVSGDNSQLAASIPLGTALRRAVIEALGNIGPAARIAVPDLQKFLNDTGKFSLGNRVFSAKAIWQITGGTNESLPVLVDALEHEDSFWAADVLAMMGAEARPAIPALHHALQSRLAYTRLRSALALKKIEPGFELPMPLLLSLLKDQNATTRFEAAQAIWSVNADPKMILPTLLDLIKPEYRTPLGMDYEGVNAIRLLGEIGPPANPAAPRLKEIVHEKRSSLTTELAVEALKKIEVDPSGVGGSDATPSENHGSGQLVQDGKVFYEMGRFDDAERSLKSALALEPENEAAKYYMNFVQEAKAKQRVGVVQTSTGLKHIVDMLNRVRFGLFGPYDRQPLNDVIRELNQMTAGLASDKTGVRIFTAENSNQREPMIDPNTGLVAKDIASGNMNINSINITIDPPLRNVTLGDVLDAVVQSADKPIKYSVLNDGIAFSAVDTQRLLSRTFKVNTNTFLARLKEQTDGQTNVTFAMRQVISDAGLDLNEPKAIFYNDRMGRLFVRATEQDLDLIERIVVQLNDAPEIHIKARFLEVPKKEILAALGMRVRGTNQPDQTIEIITRENATAALHTLEYRPGVQELAAPEVTTTSGRQTEMRATQSMTIVTNFTFVETNSVVAIVPQTNSVETGPVLDAIAGVLPDGYTVDLKTTATVIGFLGYDKPADPAVAYTSSGRKVSLPTISPGFCIRKASADVKLWDGQTVVLGLDKEFYENGKKVSDEPQYFANAKAERNQPDETKREVLVFVTVTLIDPVGNRIHSDSDMAFARNSVPQQDSQ